MQHEAIDIKTENRVLGPAARRVYIWGAGAAVVGLAGVVAATLQPGGWRRVAWAYLTNFVFFLTIALGALFFVLLQHLTRAGWSVVVRRLAEAVAANLPALAVLALPIVLNAGVLYEWAHADVVAADPVLKGKSGYLNVPFFVARLALYFGCWAASGWWLFRRSTAQDGTGDPGETLRLERWSPLLTVVFALTTTFASFDVVMSLDPRWFSTVFGVYVYGGAVTSFLALLTILMLALQRSGRLTRAVTREHYHDIGKLLFAFVVFWAYIGFSQFLLIWYGNLPEETPWYGRRMVGGWAAVSLLLLFGHFIAPFFGLISRAPKRRPALLAGFAAWLIAMHWVDIYWLVMPEMDRGARGVVPFHFADVAVLVALGGALVAVTARRLAACSLVPEGDPRLTESLTFENV